MRLKWDQWLLGLGSAIISGGSSAVVGGVVSALAFHVDVTTWSGALKIMSIMLANFSVAGFFSMFFYLKQSPLPPPVTGNTQLFFPTGVSTIGTPTQTQTDQNIPTKSP